MTAPFPFVPRAVFEYTKEWQGISRPPPSPSPPPDPTTDDELDNDHDDDKLKGKEKAIEPTHSKQSTITQDIASLISLALSDYNIWLDPDFRWKLEACLQDDVSPADAGFVPINYLLRRAPFRGSLPLADGQPEPSETEVVKALRAHASRTLEVRMRLPTSTSSASSASALVSSVWYGTGKTSRKKDVGGYEVRRRDWATLRHRASYGWSRARWDDVAAYMECIPPQYRTLGSIARFAESLLSETPTEADAELCLRVQCITFPPHYLDKPGDMPKCKGYALVTFSTKPDVETVLRAWSWRRRVPVPGNDNDDANASPVVKEALKYGLRTISKARWDALNDEYLSYKQSLVEEVVRAETAMQRPGQRVPEDNKPDTLPHPKSQTQTKTTPSSPYPFDCLVFVRNVHSGTNKTTLKSLFGQAFQDQNQDQDQDQDQDGTRPTPTTGLDYVDFTKGMDTCYLRFASPAHAMRLLAYFDARPKTQAHGLDATGRTPLKGDKPIAMEMVQGKKEEVYWEKVPEKVRRQAVDRVVQSQLASDSEVERCNETSGSRRKKRTRDSE
ncbi:hypothetical protein L210DRAFT_3405998 [Boletus edulis BED1]|uniref:XRRM domain-containing protein n=1 Tax=Boletus edulis BED1 TaxID=1328754 RepID=A0AAD4BPZ3_BOLED|nr:hypothetical protein L210DRAFT_3405998 [Boletus edulis BED1]